MSPKAFLLALFLPLASVASAQNINLGFSNDGDRQIWIGSSLPGQAPGDTDGIRTTKSDATIPIGDQKDDAKVFVWDRKTGNLASKLVKEAKTSTWEVKTTDFTLIAQVGVNVVHDSKPVAAATVDLDDGAHKATQLLDPSTKGTVTFFGIKPGSIKVTVHFKVQGKDGQPVTQIADELLTHPDAVPTIKVALAESVETVGASATSGTASSASPTDKPSAPGADKGSEEKSTGGGIGAFFGKLIIYLVALGVMAYALYYATQIVKKNPDSIGSKLEQLGVQIPKPGDDPLTDPSQIAAPVKPTPAPVQKIILDDAAPEPLNLGTSASVAPVGPISMGPVEPKLISQNGDAMPVPEGELVVGRELGLGLSLVGETTVSRKHAVLTRNGTQVSVKDCGSTNGTFVNGVQLQNEKQLQIGDTVQFGSVRFRYEG